ncbi:MAG: hypothetical protein RBS78_06185 [Coriobacteriia bacterium]|jgi:hypothetical protein|nr:hypothetical protein [Coriobacteriia bacterium]
MSKKDSKIPSTASELRQLYHAKIRAELAAADKMAPGSDAVACAGDLFAEVFVAKGEPGPAEASGGAALSGPDGEAVRKALAALGFDPDSVYATLVRPAAGIDETLLLTRLRAQVEAIDPWLVLALDGVAAADIAGAFGLGKLAFGKRILAGGREFVAVDGLEASLIDVRAKRRVWSQLQACEPRKPVL